jgi:hypothetical protein
VLKLLQVSQPEELEKALEVQEVRVDLVVHNQWEELFR